jgi:hypothetical protein
MFMGLVFLALSIWPALLAAQPPKESCITCHLETGDDRLVKPAQAFSEDIHATKGFGCASCHGGDPTAAGMEAMDPAMGYIGKPKRQEITQVCGRCHSDARFMKQYNPALRVDQVAEYNTSVHGQRLRELGDPKVATCADCHRAHAIRPPGDPKSSVNPLRVAETCGACHADAKYMEPYDIPVDQLASYKQSVHWEAMVERGDLSAPTCNDCHGNHGASPPGISWVGNVCGQCHVVMAELFAKSVHATGFVQIGAPGCATCHDNHGIMKTSDAMLGLEGDRAVCSACHAADDKGGQSATAMRTLIDSLREEYDKARVILLRAEHAGMEVSQAQFELSSAKDNLVKARTAVHTFSVEAVKKEADAGIKISTKAYKRGLRALDELRFRRRWLVLSVVIILSLIVGLVLKTRQLEQHAEVRTEHPTKEGRDD